MCLHMLCEPSYTCKLCAILCWAQTLTCSSYALSATRFDRILAESGDKECPPACQQLEVEGTVIRELRPPLLVGHLMAKQRARNTLHQASWSM